MILVCTCCRKVLSEGAPCTVGADGNVLCDRCVHLWIRMLVRAGLKNDN